MHVSLIFKSETYDYTQDQFNAKSTINTYQFLLDQNFSSSIHSRKKNFFNQRSLNSTESYSFDLNFFSNTQIWIEILFQICLSKFSVNWEKTSYENRICS